MAGGAGERDGGAQRARLRRRARRSRKAAGSSATAGPLSMWKAQAVPGLYYVGQRRLRSFSSGVLRGVGRNLTKGEPNFTLSQVAVNDAIMVVALAPIVGLLLGLSAITVPWETPLLWVGLYIVIPVIIAMLAVPILIQVYFNSGLAYLLNRMSGEAHCVAGPSALIGASNFFELAVAAAISLFGFTSGAALATVVGVLIEVPVMLSVVAIVNASKGWYERGAAVQRVAANGQTPALKSTQTVKS